VLERSQSGGIKTGVKKEYTVLSIFTALDVPERIFAVLYVSIMGLIRCYKTTVFYIYKKEQTNKQTHMHTNKQNKPVKFTQHQMR